MSLEEQITNERSPIERLPDNILLEILKYLPIKDRCQSRRVCTTWKRIVQDNSLWRHVDLRNYRLNLSQMWYIFRAHFSSCLLTLKIKGLVNTEYRKGKMTTLSNILLRELTTCCPQLELLHLNQCNTIHFLFDTLPTSLIRLEMDCCVWQSRWMQGKQKRLPNLQYLTLRMCKDMSCLDLADIVFWKDLKHLSLCGCKDIGTIGIRDIARHLTKLEFLNLNGTGIDYDAIFYIVHHLKTLKSLYLSECAVTDVVLELMASGLRVLQTLDISYCEDVTLKGIQSLFASSITVLIIKRSPPLPEIIKGILKRCFSENFVLEA